MYVSRILENSCNLGPPMAGSESLHENCHFFCGSGGGGCSRRSGNWEWKCGIQYLEEVAARFRVYSYVGRVLD